jgi:hypothetical protein
MRKLAFVCVVVFIFGAMAMAQLEPKLFEIPKTEISFGFDYQHASLSGGAVATDGNVTDTSAGIKGFAIEYSHYLHGGSLGYTIDYARDSSKAIDPTGNGYERSSYMAGPTYRLHRYGFFSPAIHALAGIDRDRFTVPSDGTTFYFSDTDFAAAAGATVDGNLTRHVAIRLAQVDYLYTHHYGNNQSSFRYIGGLVVRF